MCVAVTHVSAQRGDATTRDSTHRETKTATQRSGGASSAAATAAVAVTA